MRPAAALPGTATRAWRRRAAFLSVSPGVRRETRQDPWLLRRSAPRIIETWLPSIVVPVPGAALDGRAASSLLPRALIAGRDPPEVPSGTLQLVASVDEAGDAAGDTIR